MRDPMRDRRRRVQFTGALLVAAGIALALVRFYGDPPVGRDLESAVGSLAFGAVIAAPGGLAFLALRGRPALLLPAALVLVPLSFISFALVTLPLLIPAFLLLHTYLRVTEDRARPRSPWRAVAVLSAVVGLLLAALLALLVHPDPREYVAADTVHSTSDIITYLEAALSLALTTAAVAVGWVVAGAPEDDRRSV